MPEKTTLTSIRPFTTSELASIYDVCDKTLRKWIKPYQDAIGPRHGRYYSVVQVKIILNKLGVPTKVNLSGLDL